MANEDMAQVWTDNAEGWVDNEALFDQVFGPVTEAILATADLGEGHSVLDVGCGSGSLLVAAVAAGAEPVGVDISPGMVEAARRREAGATAHVLDAQTADLLALTSGRRFDRVVSRFGVMFFEDPAAAFANIRAACDPGARMTFACWQSQERNPMFTLGSEVLTAPLEDPPEPPRPGDPGPTAFADAEVLEGHLTRGGWAETRIEPLDLVFDYGFDGTDGVENRLTSILGTTSGRRARTELEPRLGPDGWAALLDDVRAEVARHRVDGRVQFPGAVWIVTTRPAEEAR